LEVASWRTICDSCQVPLRRQRTSIHYPVGLLIGQPRLRLVEKQCPSCHRIYRAEEYPGLVPRHGNHAFDLIVEVGLSRFLRHLQNGEIQQELNHRWGLWLSCSTIRELAQSFLDYLAATHEAHIPELRERLHRGGGYALHVDGTCEAGTDILFNVVAGNCGWALVGCKMATEDIHQIQELLRRCVAWFGQPLALVRDLSAQIETAHQQVMPDVPDLICHYHFLQNVGTRLCEKHHTKLIACLRRCKIRPALCSLRRDLVRYTKQNGSLTPVQVAHLLTAPEKVTNLDTAQRRRALAYVILCWLEDFGADLDGEYFPFDLPSLALYRRYHTIHGWLAKTMAAMDSRDPASCTLQTILRHLDAVVEDAELVAAAQRLEKAATLFAELRDVLRCSSDAHHPLWHRRSADDGALQAQRSEQRLRNWIQRLNQRHLSETNADRAVDLAIVLGYLQKYEHNLVGHVVALGDHRPPFVVQRTNNLSESRFGRTKQGLRRKLGTKSLARYVQAMRPEEFLVDNLCDPDYLQIVCRGSLENLAASFAQNWQRGQQIRLSRGEGNTIRPIPVKRKILRDDKFLSKLERAVSAMINPGKTKRVAA